MEEIRLEPYEVTITASLLNCRENPSMDAAIKHTVSGQEKHMIYEEALDAENNSWGKLEDGGWIKLSFTERKPRVQEDNEEIHE